MADIQKQNISVTPGSLQIEMSGGYITAISGKPIAGGSGGGTQTEKYYGDNINVQINYDSNTISLTPNTTALIYRDIPTKVTDLTDSANYALKTEIPDSITDFTDTSSVIYSYLDPLTGDIISQINTKQNKLQFDLNAKGEISAIGPLNNTTALAGANGITGDYYSASNPSGFINSTQAETQILEKHYLTEASGNARYIPIPEGLSDGQYYAYTTSSWKVIQGAGDVSGISTVAHDDTLTGNGNNENLGVDTTKIQTKLTEIQIQNITDVTTLKTASSTWDNVSSKLNTTDFNTYTATTAPSTYQEKGNYLSSNALEGYATTALLDTISSKIESDIPSIAGLATETDLQNVSAGVDYVSGALTGYQITGDYIVTGDILTATNNKLTGIKIGNTDYTIPTTDLTNYYTKSETSGATELSTEFGKYALKSEIPTVPTKVSDLTDSANYYKTTETSGKNELSTEFAKYLTTAQYNTDSATFALKSDLNGLVNSASVTTNDNYVMTNTGWKVLTLPGGGMTQVYHDETLTGQGNDANSKLGVVWSALSGNTINSALSAGSATSADKAASASAAKRLQDSTTGPVIQVGDITALQNWASSNSSTWDSVSAKLTTAQYAIDSATFVTSSNNSISAAGEQYALTTTGWAKVQGGGGSTITIDTTNNEIKDGTSAVSAMSYVVNPNNAYWKPQRSCVCTEAEISTMAGYANGQGMLFFVVSGHNQ